MELTLDDEGTHTLFGNHDENLRMLEDEFKVKISSRGGEIFVTGAPDNVAPVEKLLAQMQELIEQGYPLKRSDIHTGMRVLRDRPEASIVDFFTDDAVPGLGAPRGHAAQRRPEDVPAVDPGQRHHLRHRSRRNRQDLPRRRRRRRRAGRQVA